MKIKSFNDLIILRLHFIFRILQPYSCNLIYFLHKTLLEFFFSSLYRNWFKINEKLTLHPLQKEHFTRFNVHGAHKKCSKTHVYVCVSHMLLTLFHILWSYDFHNSIFKFSCA